MIPVVCRVGGDGKDGTYGDCLRACVASILDKPSQDVPHFYHDGCDGEEGMIRLREYLSSIGYAAVFNSIPKEHDFEEALLISGQAIPDCHYLMFGDGHVVVCANGEVAHDPAWVKTIPRLRTPIEDDWIIMVVTLK